MKTFLKILIVAVVLGYVFYKLVQCRQPVMAYRSQLQMGWLALAMMLTVVSNLPSAVFWRIVLVRLGQQPTWFKAIRAHFIGHLGKYTPGKAMVVLMRTDMVRGPGVKGGVAAISVFFETFTMMAVGAFLAAVVLTFWLQGHARQVEWTILAVGSMLLAGLPIVPPVFRFLVLKLGASKFDPDIDRDLAGMDFRTLLIGWGLMTLLWVGLGLSLWATIKGVGIQPGPLMQELPILTAAMALSVVLGFMSMIPAGFGVRDTALLVLLGVILAHAESLQTQGPEAITAAALVIAALHRALSILGELLVSAGLYGVKSEQN